jgi:4-hydroxybenzoate polyprenyltransferase
MTALFQRAKLYLELVKFEHTIFALPFALIGMLLAAHQTRAGLTPHTILWIVVAMVGARSAAMAFNRLVDADFDAQNPRTANRHLPRGLLSRTQVTAFLLCAAGLFVLAAAQLNRLCLMLSPVALLFTLGYSYTKRFTALCHFFLGMATGIAPIGAWLAVTGSFAWPPILLWLSVMLWIGGFDIIYALQDYDFDLQAPLYSLPKRIGKAGALTVSRLMHAIMILLLFMVGRLCHLHLLYLLGLTIVAALIFYEQSLVKPDDIRRVNLAFFTLNGWVSVTLFGFVLLDVLLH